MLLNFPLMHTLTYVCPSSLLTLRPVATNGESPLLSKASPSSHALCPSCSASLEHLFGHHPLSRPARRFLLFRHHHGLCTFTHRLWCCPHWKTPGWPFAPPSAATPLLFSLERVDKNHWIHFPASNSSFTHTCWNLAPSIPWRLLRSRSPNLLVDSCGHFLVFTSWLPRQHFKNLSPPTSEPFLLVAPLTPCSGWPTVPCPSLCSRLLHPPLSAGIPRGLVLEPVLFSVLIYSPHTNSFTPVAFNANAV